MESKIPLIKLSQLPVCRRGVVELRQGAWCVLGPLLLFLHYFTFPSFWPTLLIVASRRKKGTIPIDLERVPRKIYLQKTQLGSNILGTLRQWRRVGRRQYPSFPIESFCPNCDSDSALNSCNLFQLRSSLFNKAPDMQHRKTYTAMPSPRIMPKAATKTSSRQNLSGHSSCRDVTNSSTSTPSSKVKRWDGAKRVCTSWDSLRKVC